LSERETTDTDGVVSIGGRLVAHGDGSFAEQRYLQHLCFAFAASEHQLIALNNKMG
jgi:hypothetical protein